MGKPTMHQPLFQTMRKDYSTTETRNANGLTFDQWLKIAAIDPVYIRCYYATYRDRWAVGEDPSASTPSPVARLR